MHVLICIIARQIETKFNWLTRKPIFATKKKQKLYLLFQRQNISIKRFFFFKEQNEYVEHIYKINSCLNISIARWKFVQHTQRLVSDFISVVLLFFFCFVSFQFLWFRSFNVSMIEAMNMKVNNHGSVLLFESIMLCCVVFFLFCFSTL